MRPLRFLILLVFFVALPIALTCWSLFTSTESAADSFHAGYNTRSSRLRALFSFSTPSSLFPPSAVISLTNDNSTFFLARPAAFGPSLPSRGLSGQLWVGKGFGDDALLKEENVHIAGWELGCSDVPGWGENDQQRIQHTTPDQNKQNGILPRDLPADPRPGDGHRDGPDSLPDGTPGVDDGTDDYLHHPLEDSNPATPGEPGEPANADQADKSKKATHADIESLQESAAIAGKVVMLARGGCGFLEKVKWAQRRGGIALIVGDNERGGQLTVMYAKGDTSNVTIPALFTSYTSAHLLSSLVPPEDKDEDVNPDSQKNSQASSGSDKGKIQKEQDSRPIFTSTTPDTRQPTGLPASGSGNTKADKDRTWVKNILSAIGLSENSPFSHAEDSRRPPSSGNIDWVLLEDWDDDKPAKSPNKPETKSVSNKASTPTSSLKAKTTTSRRPGGDDFVIGVQDWRDADLVAPQPTPDLAAKKPKNAKDAATETPNAVKTSSNPETTLKGGSITPGSGEYDHEKHDQTSNRFQRGNKPSKQQSGKNNRPSQKESSTGSWIDFLRSSEQSHEAGGNSASKDAEDHAQKPKGTSSSNSDDENLEGLWVTLTPTSVSTSPFFDTLLVLVVSPLVTLTVVYALLLLRSRIRRRRWRAPKSVVERLPVRTYHTMTTTSSTTSSQVASPDSSSPTSPLLISTSQDVSRRPTNLTRTRSQTTTGIFPSASVESHHSHSQARSPPTEKPISTSKYTKRKRYTGRQVECVVCLEEYIDGESQVMSLPCGHEFHADCITPWLVNRRRTCPICKGDVVRSLARANSARWEDETLENEQTSDDVQNRVVLTTNEEPSAAIPIPVRSDEERINDDVERGRDVEEPLLGSGAHAQQSDRHGERQSLWRNIVSASVNRLSGDTLWRQTPVDRNR